MRWKNLFAAKDTLENQISIGQIVYSKSGRDKGQVFVVYSFDNQYAYLIDGNLRRLEKPKKKKFKHIQKTNYINFELQEKIQNNVRLNDAEIRKAIKKSGF